ncbi:MAG: chorismate mutase [Methanobrevibacter sp.]|jgi:chorismate mutase|nr:chorismate mutase [Candidatus Methanoflexus mossambicus]
MNSKKYDNIKTIGDAQELLKNSREKIDNIDKKIIELIDKRTSLSLDIITAKNYLGNDIYDKERENIVFNNIKSLAIEHNLDSKIILKIIKLLTDLNKSEQEKFLSK